jgi:hypothetical protein
VLCRIAKDNRNLFKSCLKPARRHLPLGLHPFDAGRLSYRTIVEKNDDRSQAVQFVHANARMNSASAASTHPYIETLRFTLMTPAADFRHARCPYRPPRIGRSMPYSPMSSSWCASAPSSHE